MNQYRCETCKKPIGKSGGTDNCPISIPSHLDVTDVFVIDLVGCASHSDFQSERNKVLDECISRIQAQQPVQKPYDDWNQGVLEGCGIASDIINELKEELQQSKEV